MSDDSSALETKLRYGPGTWFDRCQGAVAGGAQRVAELTGQLEPGHKVREALESRPNWPGKSQFVAPEGPGPALSAAKALASLSAFIVNSGGELSLQDALEHWHSANVLTGQSVQGGDVPFRLSDGKAGAALRRLAVLADNTPGEQSAGAGMAVLSVCALCDAFPASVRDVVTPALFDRRTAGGDGTLRIDCLADGPPGLYPDPRIMSLLVTDEAFGQALRTAWLTAPARLRDRCLVWRLTAPTGEPCDDVAGGSLGGAFGVALAELARAVPPLGRLRPRRLSNRCAVSARLTMDKRLEPVGGLENKLKTAQQRGLRVVLAPGGAQEHGTELERAARVRYASDLGNAYRIARTRVSGTFIAFVSLIVLASSLTGFLLHNEMNQRNQAIVNQIITEAEQLSTSDPSVAAQLLVKAYSMRPSANLDTSLIDTEDESLTARLATGSSVVEAEVSPDGHIAAIANSHSNGWDVTLWNITDPAHPQRLSTSMKGDVMAFSPNGEILAVANSSTAITSNYRMTSQNGTVTLWNIVDPAHPRKLGDPISAYPDSLDFSPDGHTLAGWGSSRSNSNSTILWDITDPAHPRQLAAIPDLTAPNVYEANCYCAEFSSDGHVLATSTGNGAVAFWSISDPAQPYRLGQLPPQASGVTSFAFSPSGQILASGDGNGSITLWNTADPARPRQLSRPTVPVGPQVLALAFSSDGQALAASDGNGSIKQWDITDPTQPQLFGSSTIPGSFTPMVAAFSLNGQALVAGDGNGVVEISTFEANTLDTGSQVGPITFGSGDKEIMVGESAGSVSLWNIADLAQPRQLSRIPAQINSITAPAFSPDGQTIASVNPGSTSFTLWNVSNPAHPRKLGPPITWSSLLLPAIAFSPNGRILAIDDAAGTVTLWDISNPADPQQLSDSIRGSSLISTAPVFGATGHVLAVLSNPSANTITLWNVVNPRNPQRIAQIRVQPSSGGADLAGIESAVFSPDQRTLAVLQSTDSTAGSGDLVTLWNVADPAHPRQLGAALDTNSDSIAFSANGQILASGDQGGLVTLWDIADPAEPKELGHPLSLPTGALVSAVAFSPYASVLAVGGGDGTVQLWNLNVNDAIDRICQTTTFTAQEWRQYLPQLPYAPPCPQ